MPVQPCSDFWLLVGGVVVQDDVDCLVLGHLGLDGIEKADELLMPVPLHVAADHRSVENIERGKQGRGPVALVVVGHCCAAAALQREAGLGAVERAYFRSSGHPFR